MRPGTRIRDPETEGRSLIALIILIVIGYLAGGYVLTQAFLRPSRPPKGMQSPEEFGLSYETWTVAGSRVPAWHFPCPDASFTLILVPALGGTVFTLQTESLGEFVRELHAAGMEVVSAPGFQPRHILSVLRTVQEHGLPRPVLMGFSIGGSTALHVAITEPVAALVLDGVVDNLGRVLWKDLTRQGPLVRLLLPALRLFLSLYRSINGALHAAVSLSQVREPVLLVYGEREYLVEEHMNRELMAAVQDRPQSGVFMVPDTGHCYGPTDHPALYAERVVRFLDGVKASELQGGQG
jgi:pimeloyl-ACP methyl ester carboxylesterase